MRVVVAVTAAALVVVGVASASPQQSSAQHVTVIGDSVAEGMSGDADAVAILTQGIDLDLETAPCRRVDGDSCPYEGVRVPTLVELAKTLGPKLGPNVVVAVGYNDFESAYAQNIRTALTTLRAQGAKRIWWLTLRAARHPLVNMNDDIEAAAAAHPELEVIDWNLYSRSHPDWFQVDGLHLLAPGSEAMATLIHKTLVDDAIAAAPVRVMTTMLPEGKRGRPYATTLRAAAGVTPYRWSLLERAPAGIHLEANGLVVGKPRVRPGRYAFDVRVRDSSGYAATRHLTLRVRA
jgi:sirohydrochlorin ferrochelatase